MTKQEFLNRMDTAKLTIVYGLNDHSADKYSCHAIETLSEKALVEYERLFDRDQNENYKYIPANFASKEDPTCIRIAALELFEIISIEEGLYVNY